MKYTLSTLLLFMQFTLFAQYPIVTIDNQTYGPNEPSIYINPANPAQIVAGSNIHNHYVSSDTGKTWEIKTLRSSHGVYGDPVIYADEYGNFYFCHLAATKTKKYPNWIDRIVVQKSDDGGQNFNDGSYAGHNGDKEQDKHWIVKDQHSLLHKDNIYLSWTEFDKYDSKDTNDYSRIRFARSVDGAASFEEAKTISDTVGGCLDDDNTLEGATPAIGKNGEVYVAWGAFGKIYFDKSTDGGRTWDKDRVIATQDDGWALDYDQIYRSNGLPFLVADHSRGKYKNRLYLCWGENEKGKGGEIKLKYSDDGGDTWNDEIRVNDNSFGDQFLPHIAIDQTDGTVYVVFYDRRNSASNILMDVYVAFSEDGGQTFTNKLITPQPIVPPGKEVFFGDYNGISANRGIVRPIWTGTDETLQGKLTIQTALLTKDLLKTKNQVLTDTVFFKYLKGEANNTFVLYSTKNLIYKIKIKVKKQPYSLFWKTYKVDGLIYSSKNDLDKNYKVKLSSHISENLITGKGKKITLKMEFIEKEVYRKYKLRL
ncbi:MAG: sialidase family protein [Bacteroidia bacterium]